MAITNGQFEGVDWGEFRSPAPTSAPTLSAALSGPQARLQANRDRITRAGNPRKPDSGGETVPINRYGLTDATTPEVVRQRKLGPFDSVAYRRHGEDRFVNLVGEGAAHISQAEVNPARVKQIATDPSKGSDPRFPWPEKPVGEELPSGVTLIHNGTHRMAAAAGFNGQLFTEARIVPADKRWQAAKDQADGAPAAHDARALRNELEWKRYSSSDPTITAPDRGARLASFRKKRMGAA